MAKHLFLVNGPRLKLTPETVTAAILERDGTKNRLYAYLDWYLSTHNYAAGGIDYGIFEHVYQVMNYVRKHPDAEFNVYASD